MFPIVRRIALAALTAFAFAPLASLAEAPMQRTQAPGWYRQMVGDIEVTALLDGTAKLPVKDILTHAGKKQVDTALKNAFLADQVETSVNAFLVNTGKKLVLI